LSKIRLSLTSIKLNMPLKACEKLEIPLQLGVSYGFCAALRRQQEDAAHRRSSRL
jgi:hypothetical protein